MKITTMTLGLLGALALMPVAVKAAPIKWVYASQSADGSSRWFYDANSVVNEGRYRAFVVRINDADGARSFMGAQVDCSDQSFRTLWYRGIISGRDQTDTTPSRWSFYEDTSNIAYIANGVCA